MLDEYKEREWLGRAMEKKKAPVRKKPTKKSLERDIKKTALLIEFLDLPDEDFWLLVYGLNHMTDSEFDETVGNLMQATVWTEPEK